MALAFSMLLIKVPTISIVLLRQRHLTKSKCQFWGHSTAFDWLKGPVPVLHIKYLLVHAPSKNGLPTVQLSS
jgi:hypothetical protein